MSFCFFIADNFLSSNNETAASLYFQTMQKQWLLTRVEFFSDLQMLCTSFAIRFLEFNVEQKGAAAFDQSLSIVISLTISMFRVQYDQTFQVSHVLPTNFMSL